MLWVLRGQFTLYRKDSYATLVSSMRCSAELTICTRPAAPRPAAF